jgi:hypothetical protein
MQGLRPILVALALALLQCVLPARAQEPAAGPPPVATVKTLSGAAFVDDGASRARVPAAVGAKLRAGDRLVTGGDGAMGVTFTDNSTLSLGPDSEIRVERFAYDPPANDYGFAARIAQGTFLFVTGRIAQSAPQSVAVTTPSGSIDIRGARVLVKVEPP